MPRNRAEVTRDEKLDEIVSAARRRLEAEGFAGMSVAGIARDLGLSQNAIYWYFPTKDHLLIATIERILHDVLERKPRGGLPVERILWFANRLHEFQELRLTVRDRARVSTVVASFERDVLELLHVLLRGSLSGAVPEAELDVTVDAVMALCEGVLLRDLPTRERNRVLRFGLDRLIG